MDFETAMKMILEFQTYSTLCLARLNACKKRVWCSFEHEDDSVRKQVKGVQPNEGEERPNVRLKERESVQMKQNGKRSKEQAAMKGVGSVPYGGWDGKSRQRLHVQRDLKQNKKANINNNNNLPRPFNALKCHRPVSPPEAGK